MKKIIIMTFLIFFIPKLFSAYTPIDIKKEVNKELEPFREEVSQSLTNIKQSNLDLDSKIAKVDSLNNLLETKIKNLDKKIIELDNKIYDQKRSSIEIIGLFAAIMGLIFVNVGAIKSAKTYLGAIVTTMGLTFSMAVFASLFHIFFSSKPTYGPLWISIVGLIILLGVGIWQKDKAI